MPRASWVADEASRPRDVIDDGRLPLRTPEPLGRAGLPRTLEPWSRRLAMAACSLAPLPFGSVEPHWVAAWGILLAVSVLTSRLGRLDRFDAVRIAPILALLLLWALAATLQLSPNPPVAPDPAWARMNELLGTTAPPLVSTTSSGPWRALGPALVFGLALVRAQALARDRGHAEELLLWIAAAGLVFALYGLVSSFLAPDHLLWRERLAYRGLATGTFANRNTAAAYFGGCAAIWLLFALRWLLREGAGRGAVLRGIAALVCFAAMTATGSRAGFVVSCAALVGAATIFLHGRGVLGRFGRLGLVGSLVAAALFVEFVGGNISQRLKQYGAAETGRLSFYRDGLLPMAADRPWLGAGLGNFEAVFPRYRPAGFGEPGIFARAHSTPMEVAVEMGFPLAIALAFGWVCLLLGLARDGWRRRRGRLVPCAAVGFAGLGAVHSLVDFTLQIPGYAIVCACVLGLGLGQHAARTRSRAASAASP